jgi:hypothetical protein
MGSGEGSKRGVDGLGLAMVTTNEFWLVRIIDPQERMMFLFE